jgi:hypothetical protein
VDRLSRKVTGRYTWEVRADGFSKPVTQETGVYSLAPIRTTFTRVLTNPDPSSNDAAQYTVHVRRLGHISYMQMEDWGQWDGCWLSFTAGDIESQTGIDVSGGPDLPVGVLVPLNATVSSPEGSWLGPPYREFTAQISGAAATQFLGMTARVLSSHAKDLQSVRAPIVLSVDADGQVHGAKADGNAVASALRDQQVDLGTDLMSFLSVVSATVEFSALGTHVGVAAPPSSRLLPDDAAKDQTCPANR